MTTAYYNEKDPFAAAWLRELIKAGYITPGEVDERSIEDVRPADLRYYTQCHFFAGIGVWSYALRQAGWPDDRPVWSGSCPCQPFSTAGKRGGTSDERHLWPAFYHLISQCKPAIVFGEQVASKAGLSWLNTVQSDLEGAGYAFGAADLCAAGVGAPHIRQRLYFVADTPNVRCEQRGETPTSEVQRNRTERERKYAEPEGERKLSGGFERLRRVGQIVEHPQSEQMGFPRCTWFDGKPVDWVYCRDEKYRPIEPGTFPLVDGDPNRVGRLRGYGNALVAPVAQTFIESYLGATS